MTKFAETRPYADPDVAARKLIEIAHSVEPVQDGGRLLVVSAKGNRARLLCHATIKRHFGRVVCPRVTYFSRDWKMRRRLPYRSVCDLRFRSRAANQDRSA